MTFGHHHVRPLLTGALSRGHVGSMLRVFPHLSRSAPPRPSDTAIYGAQAAGQQSPQGSPQIAYTRFGGIKTRAGVPFSVCKPCMEAARGCSRALKRIFAALSAVFGELPGSAARGGSRTTPDQPPSRQSRRGVHNHTRGGWPTSSRRVGSKFFYTTHEMTGGPLCMQKLSAMAVSAGNREVFA